MLLLHSLDECVVTFLPDVGIHVHVLWQLLNSLLFPKDKAKHVNE